MIRQLQPWHANLRKRQVRSPKVFVRDSGLLRQLLGIDSAKALASHPKLGASWEGLAIEQILTHEAYDEAAFWATHQGAELLLEYAPTAADRRRIMEGVEEVQWVCRKSHAGKIKLIYIDPPYNTGKDFVYRRWTC